MAGAAYVDAIQLLADWLASQRPDATVRTSVPDNLQDLLVPGPVIVVQPVEGHDPYPGLDDVTLDVDFFTGLDGGGNPDFAGASDGAEQVRALVRFDLPGYVATFPTATGTVLMAATASAPRRRPWDDTTVARYQASYQLRVHTRAR